MNKTENKTKKTYVKPETEVVNMELENPILQSSGEDFGNGGFFG